MGPITRWSPFRCWPAEMPDGAGQPRSADGGETADAAAADHQADSIAAGRALAAALDLELLPLEGGLFRRTFTGGGASAILFMLVGSDFSAMHRLHSDEIYFHHAGSPLRMLLIAPDGAHREVDVGGDVQAGEQPQFHVPEYWWQGSSVYHEPGQPAWSLVSTVVTPGFDWHDFVLGDRDQLIELVSGAGGSAVADRIVALTRTEPLL